MQLKQFMIIHLYPKCQTHLLPSRVLLHKQHQNLIQVHHENYSLIDDSFSKSSPRTYYLNLMDLKCFCSKRITVLEAQFQRTKSTLI